MSDKVDAAIDNLTDKRAKQILNDIVDTMYRDEHGWDPEKQWGPELGSDIAEALPKSIHDAVQAERDAQNPSE